VGELVPGQVVLALQRRIADVADEAPLHGVRDDVLLDEAAVRIGHLALRAAVERRAVQRLRLTDLARLGARLLLLWWFLLFGLLAGGRARAAAGVRGAHGSGAGDGAGATIGHCSIGIAIDPIASAAIRQRRSVGVRHVGHVTAMVHAHQSVVMAAVRPIVAGRQGHAPQRQAGQVGAILQDIACGLLLDGLRVLEEVLYGDGQCGGEQVRRVVHRVGRVGQRLPGLVDILQDLLVEDWGEAKNNTIVVSNMHLFCKDLKIFITFF